MDFKLALSTCLLLSTLFSAYSYSQTVPFLDFYPNCIDKTLDSAHEQYLTKLTTEQIKHQTEDELVNIELSKALIAIQKNASQLGATAIIINNKFSVFRKSNNHKASSITTNIHADYITLCEHDKTLTTNRTPVGSDGHRVLSSHTFSVSTTFGETNQNRAKKARQHKLASKNISLLSAYDVELGQNQSALSVLGPESIRLSLSNGNQLLGYGRSLWVMLKNDEIIQLSSQQNTLNVHGLNFIDFNSNYDDKDWLFNQKYSKGDPIHDITSNEGYESHNGRITVKGHHSTLLTKSRMDTNTGKSAYYLEGFNLTGSTLSQPTSIASFPEASFDLTGIFHTPEKAYSQPHINNHLYLHDDKPWLIASPFLLINADAEQVNALIVTESMFSQENTGQFSNLASYLKLHQLPTTKAEFFAQYPTALDDFDQATYDKQQVQITAKFSSYDDDAEVIELRLEYF
ncbi:hypothetical protein [Shewanella maritima]|uniref:hypothetical protein n=1 Tax=Shewanella maritima TaxID=2520507 RepID=UPI003734E21F